MIDFAAIARMSGADLRLRWTEVFGRPAPLHLSTPLLRSALAHRLQERAIDRLDPRIVRRLHRLAADERSAKPMPTTLRAGARLVREWQGKNHIVEVIDGGFRWQSRNYPSLTQIARAITGTHWSGPRFFGLRNGRQSSQPQDC